MAYWEYLDLDEQTKKALKIRDEENKRKRRTLLLFLIIVLFFTYFLSSIDFISRQTFELIFAAFIGGFIGASLEYIIGGDR